MSDTAVVALIVTVGTVVVPVVSGWANLWRDKRNREGEKAAQADALRSQIYQYINQCEMIVELAERKGKEPPIDELLNNIYSVRALLPSVPEGARAQFRKSLTDIRNRANIPETTELAGASFDLLPLAGTVPTIIGSGPVHYTGGNFEIRYFDKEPGGYEMRKMR